jgi:hypothetical protein
VVKKKFFSFLVCVLLILALPGWTGGAVAGTADNGPGHAGQIPRSGAAASRAGFGLAAYDSGWVDAGFHESNPVNIILDHNLGGDPDAYLVDLQCWDDSTLGYYNCVDANFNPTAHWRHLNTVSVTVRVIAGNKPNYVRVRIYRPSPDYDSGWQRVNIRPDSVPVAFTHGLGDPFFDDYLVSLTCQSAVHGTFDCTGLENGSFRIAAYWFDLTSTGIRAMLTAGSEPSYVRMRIFRETPTFANGWRDLGNSGSPAETDVYFPAEWDLNRNVVQIQCYSTATASGIFNCGDPNFFINAIWLDMEDDDMRIRSIADNLRVKVQIWANFGIYFPMITR